MTGTMPSNQLLQIVTETVDRASSSQYYATKSQPQSEQMWTEPGSSDIYWQHHDISQTQPSNAISGQMSSSGSAISVEANGGYYLSEDIKYLVTDLSDCLKTESWMSPAGQDQTMFSLPDQEQSYTFL